MFEAHQSVDGNKETVRRFFKEVLNGKNMESANQLVDPGFVDHAAPPHPGTDLEFLHAFWPHVWRVAFPDWQINVEDMVAEADRVTVRYTAGGTHKGEFMGMPASGKTIHVTGMNMFRLTNGKIAEEWANLDMLALMQQLGAIPSPPQG